MYVKGNRRSATELEVTEISEKYIKGFIDVLWRPKSECRHPQIGDVLEIRESSGQEIAIPPVG